MIHHMPPDQQLSDAAVRSFIERFALVLAAAGMQRMAARAFAALLVSEDGSMTAREFADLLQVSPAAVSGSVRYLENARMVRRARRPGDRTDHWTLGGESWYEAVGTRTDIIDALAAALDEGLDAVPESGQAAERMAEMRDFFTFLGAEMPRVIARWRASRSMARNGADVGDADVDSDHSQADQARRRGESAVGLS
jgi:DNA-binding transcriptional regulator GbsR (MarR family)